MLKIKANYRNVLPQDISAITKIDLSAFSNLVCEDEEIILERIKIFPEGFRIMEIDNEAAGYISSEIWDRVAVIDRALFALNHSIEKQHNPSGTELYITSMGILPEHKGKGVGESQGNRMKTRSIMEFCFKNF